MTEQDISRDSERPECFVIMPISDPDGYPAGHFLRVFEDIFKPACEQAGYIAIRADDVKETNLIHVDVLKRLLTSPVALCDLSSRNPNVLFELGLRQAFDKPVVLVQDIETPSIFDIAPLRSTRYRRARLYHEVLDDQKNIAKAINATAEATDRDEGVNSLVKLLALSKPASIPELKAAESDPALQIIQAEISELRSELRQSNHLMWGRRVLDRNTTIADQVVIADGRLIDILRRNEQGLRWNELATAVGLNSHITHRALKKLRNVGVIIKDERTGCYRLADIVAEDSDAEGDSSPR